MPCGRAGIPLSGRGLGDTTLSRLIPPRPIHEYPPLRRDEDWQKLLKYSQAMLERLQARHCLPESDEQLQAVVHLFQTLASSHYRRLH